MSQFLTSKEMFINMKNVPKYDYRKSYFEQSTDVIQFYEEEFRKLTQGVMIGGYWVHPWMYFHLNFFITPIPVRNNYGQAEEILMSPKLDDNFLFIVENYADAEKQRKGIGIFGTRGSTKSTALASNMHWTNMIKPNGVSTITGGDRTDLGDITSLILQSVDNINPAFRIPTLKREVEKEIQFGIKLKNGDPILHSRIKIVNADQGKGEKSSEKGAGGSPVGFILDEALHEDSIIYYENGEKPIKDVQVGDFIFGADGQLTEVKSKINPGVQDTWKFTLSDGREVISSANHRWYVKHNGVWKTTTTAQILGFVGTIELPEQPTVDCANVKSVQERTKRCIELVKGFLNTSYGLIISQDLQRLEEFIKLSRSLGMNYTTPTVYDGELYMSKPHTKPVTIDSIENSGEANVFCIGVSNRDEMFLTNDYIPTKNCGKYQFLGIWESATPAFTMPDGFKLVPILSGTSGNAKLSADAKKVMTNPDSYNIITMNYDKLERGLDPDEITWEKTKKQKFATFMPGQMSYRLDTPKIERPFSEVIGINSPELKAIKINTTDWSNANIRLQEKLNLAVDDAARDRERMYFPRDLDDIFLTKGHNPFPKAVITKRINYLKDIGGGGSAVEIEYDEGSFTMNFSDKETPQQYYPGGIVDAPIQLFTELPSVSPSKYVNVSGMDHYKLDGEAIEGSYGALYTIKRRNQELNQPCEIILASYVARPDRHRTFNTNAEKLIRAFNAECNLESLDLSFQQHLDTKGVAEELLCPAFSFAQGAQAGKSNTSLRTRFGLFPTKGNNDVRWNNLIEWSKEEHVVGFDDIGNPIIKLSVEFIDDIQLLQEMLDYKKGGNFDRLDAFSYALILAKEYDKNEVNPIKEQKAKKYVENPSKTRRSAYTTRRSSPYRR